MTSENRRDCLPQAYYGGCPSQIDAKAQCEKRERARLAAARATAKNPTGPELRVDRRFYKFGLAHDVPVSAIFDNPRHLEAIDKATAASSGCSEPFLVVHARLVGTQLALLDPAAHHFVDTLISQGGASIRVKVAT